MAAIAANTAGFGRLDEYYIWDEVTGTLTTVRSKSIPRTTRTARAGGEGQDQRLRNQAKRTRVRFGQRLPKQKLSEDREVM